MACGWEFGVRAGVSALASLLTSPAFVTKSTCMAAPGACERRRIASPSLESWTSFFSELMRSSMVSVLGMVATETAMACCDVAATSDAWTAASHLEVASAWPWA